MSSHEPIPVPELARRRERLAERLEEHGLDAVFLPPSSDLEYLTGLQRDVPSFGQVAYANGWVAGAFFGPGDEPLFVLPRMVVAFHLHDRAPDRCLIVDESDDGEALFADAACSLGAVERIAIGGRTWGQTVLHLRRVLPSSEVVDATPIVNELRRVKSELELQLLTEACRIAEDAMAETAPRVLPGVSPLELSEEIEHQLRVRGSRTPSFPTHIFTFGRVDSRDSTHASGTQPIRDGEPLQFDFG
ncbi:MAG: aminopeptidase P family protein, partial [Actinobacteria bacterium]